MTNAAFVQRLLHHTFATLDYRARAAHLDDDVVVEVTPPLASLGDITSLFLIEDLSAARAIAPAVESA